MTFRIIFGPFGIILEAFFGPWEHFGGTVGSLFDQKSALGSKGAPRGATPEINSPFWRPVGTLFLNMCVFFAKKGVLK